MSLTVYKFNKKEQVENKIKNTQTGAVIVFGIKPCGPCDILEHFISTWKPDFPVNLFELRHPEFEDMASYREKFGLEKFPTVAIVDDKMNIKETKIIPGGNKNLFIDLVMRHKDLLSNK